MLGRRGASAPRNGLDQATLDSLLDALGGTDTGFLFTDASGKGLRDMRNNALRMPAFSRCVQLISTISAQLITQGALRVMDMDGKAVMTPTAKGLLQLLSESPDGFLDGYTWFQDFVTDYAVEGNALAEISRADGGRRVRMLRRLQSYDATTVMSGAAVYYESQIADGDGARVVVESDLVAHCRWPRMARRSQFSATNRSVFAVSPVSLLHPALQIALAGDRFINEFFKGGHTARVGISVPRVLTDDQLQSYQKLFEGLRNSRSPLIMDSGATFTSLDNDAASQGQEALMNWQVEQVGRLFSVPAPILNQQLTSWGQGIESLVRIFWRFGLWQHVTAVLAPLSHRMLPKGQRFSIDPTDIVRGDSRDTAQLLTALAGDAQRGETATTEERRRIAGLPIEPHYGELKEPPPPPEPPGGDSGAMDGGDNLE